MAVFLNYRYNQEIKHLNITDKLSECTFQSEKFKFEMDNKTISFMSPFSNKKYTSELVPHEYYFDFNINEGENKLSCAVVPYKGFNILNMGSKLSLKIDQAWDYYLIHQYLTYFCVKHFKDTTNGFIDEDYSGYCQSELL